VGNSNEFIILMINLTKIKKIFCVMSEESLVFSLIKRVYAFFNGEEVKALKDKIAVCFRNSVIGKSSELREIKSVAKLDKSQILNFFDKIWCQFLIYVKSSWFVGTFLEGVLSTTHFLRAASIVIVIMSVTIFILSFLYINQIHEFVFVVTTIFFCLGSIGCLCRAPWEELKKTSLFLKKWY